MTHFLQKFNHCDSLLFNMVRLFKAIRLFCPLAVRRLQPDLNHIDELRLLPTLDDDVIVQGLKDELPALLVSAANMQACSSRLRWWREQEKLPYWQSAAKVVFCLVPSSAAAERVFSLLQAVTTDSQARLFSDHLEAMLQLQYNRSQ